MLLDHYTCRPWQWLTRRRAAVNVQGDSLVYQVQKQIKELGDKVPAETVSKVEEKVKELEEALKGEDTDKIKVRPVMDCGCCFSVSGIVLTYHGSLYLQCTLLHRPFKCHVV
jgi:Hsp70 protein